MLDYSCNKMEIIIGKKALQKTWKYSTENTEDHSGLEDIDPRWAKLKDILNNKTK